MSGSLLSFSEVLLFGRLVRELKIKKEENPEAKVGSTENIADLKGLKVNGQTVAVGDKILIKDQKKKKQNGIYTVSNDANKTWKSKEQFEVGTVVKVLSGEEKGFWLQRGNFSKGRQRFKEISEKKAKGQNSFLSKQLGDDARFAKIYGFAYEGTYFDLPEPTIFLVHGEGDSATDGDSPGGLASRAPNNPTLSGVAAADFQIADDIRVWDYDKADYTIRMDVMTGMFEQVLLDVCLGDGVGISGAKVSGAKVSGAKVSGAKVSGAKVSGAKVSGAKARGD
ncbi:hypothetical protein [Ruegeria sp.]|uniref:hypothetical protein n=1 Tax=Ruegeria sp. TaxID=1879320 RepID=UPI003C7B9A83